MEVRYTFICDCANISREGKLNVMGILNTIYAPQFPFAHPAMVYVAGIEARKSEAGKHQIRVNIVDADGHDITSPLQGELNISPNVPLRSTHNVILNINNLKIQKPGTYSIELIIDNQHAQSNELHIVERK